MPKISKPLTTTEVKNYKPESKMYKKPDGKGLWLIINPNGTKFRDMILNMVIKILACLLVFIQISL
jgi:hypothetical protein